MIARTPRSTPRPSWARSSDATRSQAARSLSRARRAARRAQVSS